MCGWLVVVEVEVGTLLGFRRIAQGTFLLFFYDRAIEMYTSRREVAHTNHTLPKALSYWCPILYSFASDAFKYIEIITNSRVCLQSESYRYWISPSPYLHPTLVPSILYTTTQSIRGPLDFQVGQFYLQEQI